MLVVFDFTDASRRKFWLWLRGFEESFLKGVQCFSPLKAAFDFYLSC